MPPRTRMEPDQLYRLLAWLSPSYPVGAFTHSHGLEWAVAEGAVADREATRAWIADALAHGGGRNDAILFAHAFRAVVAEDANALADVCDLARAAATTHERRIETMSQGRAFLRATVAAWPSPAFALCGRHDEIAYPVAVAVAAAGHGLPLAPSLAAYLQAWAANLVSAAQRLVPLGQSDGQRLIALLAPVVAATVADGLSRALDELGGAAVLAEIAAMRHETQYTRLFRT